MGGKRMAGIRRVGKEEEGAGNDRKTQNGKRGQT